MANRGPVDQQKSPSARSPYRDTTALQRRPAPATRRRLKRRLIVDLRGKATAATRGQRSGISFVRAMVRASALMFVAEESNAPPTSPRHPARPFGCLRARESGGRSIVIGSDVLAKLVRTSHRPTATTSHGPRSSVTDPAMVAARRMTHGLAAPGAPSPGSTKARRESPIRVPSDSGPPAITTTYCLRSCPTHSSSASPGRRQAGAPPRAGGRCARRRPPQVWPSGAHERDAAASDEALTASAPALALACNAPSSA